MWGAAPGPIFRRSSFCSAGSCVEVAEAEGGGAVVRAAAESGVTLSFAAREWADFVAGVKAGEFDFPLPRAAAD